MKKVLISCALTLVFITGVLVVSAASSSFSGTWVLDKSKSQGLPPQLENVESYTLAVSQDDQQLAVETKVTGGGRPRGGEPGVGGQGGGRRPDGVPGQDGGRRPDGVPGQDGGRRPDGAGGGGQGPGRGGRGGFGMGTAIYKLDGTETKMESAGGRGGAATLKAQWKDGGKALELMTTRTMNFQGNETTRTTKEHWELTDGGKTLTVKRTVDGSQGTQEYTLVFTRQ